MKPTHPGRLPRWSMILLMLTAAVPLAAQTTAPATRPAEAVTTYQKWVKDLASGRMEGRGPGTRGIELARDYIVERLEAFGLRPAFGARYTQPFTVRFGAKAKTRELALRSGRGKPLMPLAAGEDFNVLGFSANGAFKAPAVFVGYGCKSSDHKYESYADADAVRGKVAIAFRYEPMHPGGRSKWGGASITYGGWSEAAFLNNKARWAAEAGAAALLLVNPPSQDREKALRSTAGSAFGGRAKIPVYHITSALLQRLLRKPAAAGEAAVRELEAKANAAAQPPMPLADIELSGEVKVETARGEVHNVAAKLPGVGQLAEQVVLVGAHYDHLGYGGRGSRGGGGKIHPGADDNASGTAGVVMLAKWLSERALPADQPRRTLVFATFSAEEIGLLGSRYMADHLSEMGVTAKQVVAMLNLDMIGRLRDGRIGVYGLGTAKAWPKIVKTAARGLALKPRLGASASGGSDHLSFVRHKIPVLFFNSGGHRDYHTPRDTAEKINPAGAVEVCRLIERILVHLATAAAPPQFDAQGVAAARRQTYRGPRSGAYLGILPDLVADQGEGCRIGEVLPDGPAAKAGLKPGDVIVHLHKKPTPDLRLLMQALAECKPGQAVAVQVRRGEETLDLTVTLGQR